MNDRKCPDCGERLSFDSLRCACGWGIRKGEKPGKLYDHRCIFTVGSTRCSYPVGLFREGNTSGWCIFHRQSQPADGTEIVMQSQRVPYLQAIRQIQERDTCAASVVQTAHDIALRHGKKPWQAGNERALSAALRGGSGGGMTEADKMARALRQG